MKVLKSTIGLLASLSLTVACSRNPETFTPTNPSDNNGPTSEDSYTKTNCVRVLYDRTSDPKYALGRAYAIYVLNLLGHFAEFKRHMSAVEDYKSGELDKCGVNIYIGSTYDNALPTAFIEDFKTSSSRNAWLGYNSWKLGSSLQDIFGVRHNSVEPFTVLDYTHTTPEVRDVYDSSTGQTTQKTFNNPTFYKNVIYKGKSFPKYGSFGKTSADETHFYSAFEVNHYDYDPAQVVDKTEHSVLAEIEHNYTLDKIPWAIQSKNRFLIAEVPLSFVHMADRYLVFADLLFDILNASPRHDLKPAVIRLEDIHAKSNLVGLQRARQILKQNSVPPQVAVIPIYLDPLDTENIGANRPELPISSVPSLVNELKGFESDGGSIIWHGITHQLGNLKNPWQGTTAADYEFWDFTDDVANNVPAPVYGHPVPNDSISNLNSRFKTGSDVFEAAVLQPKIWLTPHYHASSLDNYFFGQNFDWNIGRVIYYLHTMQGLNLNSSNSAIKFPNTSPESWSAREYYLKNLVVDQELSDQLDGNGQATGNKVYRSFGQMFPYEIYGDIYGQKLFPENLGNVIKNTGAQNPDNRSVQQMLADAERNLVLRDTWASGFFHTYFLQAPSWTAANDLTNNDLNDLVVGLKNLGYQFVNLESFPTRISDQAKVLGTYEYKEKASAVIYH